MLGNLSKTTPMMKAEHMEAIAVTRNMYETVSSVLWYTATKSRSVGPKAPSVKPNMK